MASLDQLTYLRRHYLRFRMGPMGRFIAPALSIRKKRHHSGKSIFPTRAIILENGFLDFYSVRGHKKLIGTSSTLSELAASSLPR